MTAATPTATPTATIGDTSQARARASRRFAPVRARLAMLVFATVFAFVVTGPIMSYKPQPFTGEGSPLRQIGYVVTLGLTLLAMRPMLRPDRLLALPLSMVVVLAWCWLSLGWAIDPGIGLRRLMLTTIFTWTMFVLVAHVEPARAMAILRWIMVTTLLLNFATVFVLPDLGVHQASDEFDKSLAGAWRGMMIQKNFAGAMCAFTILAFLFDAKRIHPFVRLAVIAAAAVFIYFSQSKTSAGILVLAIAAGALYGRYNPAYRALLIPVSVVALVTGFIFAQVYWQELIAPLNDRSALTGRTQIWPLLIAYARDHPMLGSGYGSFWNIGYGIGPIFRYDDSWIKDYATQGHNGYLDVLVTIGLPGLILAVAATLVVPFIRLLSSRTIGRGQGAFLMATLLFCAGHNLTESSLLERDVIVEAFLIFAVATIYTATARGPRRRPPCAPPASAPTLATTK